MTSLILELRRMTELFQSLPDGETYMDRHDVMAEACLTVMEDETAGRIAEHLAPRIAGKTVVEIGGGIGLLALHMGAHAKRVFCIEANPMWGWAFVTMLLKHKPANVSFLLGAAEEFVGAIEADVAVFCTHSGVEDMRQAAGRLAPVVIDFHGELIAGNPDAFDPLARELRKVAVRMPVGAVIGE